MPRMHGSKTVDNLTDLLKAGVDIPNDDIDGNDVIMWINELEQMIYRDYIKNIVKAVYNEYPVTLDGIDMSDIVRVFYYDCELARGNGNTLVPMTYYSSTDTNGNETLYITPEPPPQCEITVYYNSRPQVKTTKDENLHFSDEWLKLPLSYCKYKLCSMYNEESQANKYITEFNAHLQDFALWVSEHFGTTF